MVRARLREQIGRIIPFFERHLLVLASPHDGLPPELPETTDEPPIAPTEMEPVITCDLPRVLGVSGVSHATGMKNKCLSAGHASRSKPKVVSVTGHGVRPNVGRSR